ncbi:MAG: YggS family pyridoxal phosphate-dependent enzyme [Spirochaetaceae bacterium]|nr:YggS family pyridoxal phosphate-dependent enzyme [Spirochaetaceae bacterium]
MTVSEALESLRERILKACLRSGRQPGEVRLMGVSKFHALPKLEEAWEAGLRLFGENRVQEAAQKFEGFKTRHPETELHMIGSLQRNKAKTAVSLFDWVQSVDRDELLTELGALTAGRERPLPILLEMNAGEDSKSGYPDEDSLLRAAEKALSLGGLRIRGLMIMAPFTDETPRIRGAFRSLVRARDHLAAEFPGCDWSCLSMGMSGDFEIAVEEGSTLVRIGTALFGERNP